MLAISEIKPCTRNWSQLRSFGFNKNKWTLLHNMNFFTGESISFGNLILLVQWLEHREPKLPRRGARSMSGKELWQELSKATLHCQDTGIFPSALTHEQWRLVWTWPEQNYDHGTATTIPCLSSKASVVLMYPVWSRFYKVLFPAAVSPAQDCPSPGNPWQGF